MDKSCYLAVSEVETLMMASAIIEANATNAHIYATLYIEPTLQDAASITYTPSVDVYKLIENFVNGTETTGTLSHYISSINENNSMVTGKNNAN